MTLTANSRAKINKKIFSAKYFEYICISDFNIIINLHMEKTLLCTLGLSMIAISASSFKANADDLTPGSPSLSMKFEIVENAGIVTGKVTAPTRDANWTDLPESTKMEIRVIRSCYTLNETEIPVASFSDVSPGAEMSFTDNAEPGWQYGYQYTYNAVASIGDNNSYYGYGSMSPGISFSFGYEDVSATAKETDGGGFEVEISALVPSKTGYPAEDIPVDMTALELYKVTDRTSYPYTTELIDKIDSPTKGETYVFTDKNPVLNEDNYYVVKCICPFGAAEKQTYTFVGYDVPTAPYPINAETVDGGVRIYWTAPDSGEHYGQIKPEDTYYIVSRCWGSSEDQKKVIADNLKETEFVDYGTDLESPLKVRYEVMAANNLGEGGSNYSGYEYDFIIGPDESLPYIETFDNGKDHVWDEKNNSYYCPFYTYTEAEFGDDIIVKPQQGDGLIYADYSNNYGNAANDLTSHFIDTKGSQTVGLSFWYYAIPADDITIDVQLSKNGGDFNTLKSISISDGVTDSQWREAFVALEDVAESRIQVRFHITAPTSKLAAVLDNIRILEYKPASGLNAEYNPEDCEAIITWDDPSTEYTEVVSYNGYVDGENIGTVESPWSYKPGEYRENHQIAVQAVYEHISAQPSAPITVSVPRPAYTEFEVADHIFAVKQISAGANEVTIKKYLGTDELYKNPELINYDNKAFTVVGIDDEAYTGNTTIASVTLTDGIATIGQAAFKECTSLMAVSFGTGLTEIGAEAFKGCTSLISVIFNTEEPPTVADDAFEGIHENCKGKCPEGSELAYSQIEGLNPIDFGYSSVMSIDDATSVEYFDLQGNRVLNPAAGEPVIVRVITGSKAVTLKKVFNR